VIAFLREENRVLNAQLRGRRRHVENHRRNGHEGIDDIIVRVGR
jgi:hypothetical protein